MRAAALLLVFLVSAGCCGGRAGLGSSSAPLIGISSVYIKSEDGGVDRMMTFLSYVEAVKEAGAIPVVLPPLDDPDLRQAYIRRLDGLLLVGGRDIPPDVYGEQPHPAVVPMARERWESESKLLKAWLASRKPVLGICLGSQFANVVQGGTLIQDIPSQVGTSVSHSEPEGAMHEVRIKDGSRLHHIIGSDRALVWARHHQAVKDVGEGLVVTAHTADGVIEGLEMPGHPFAVFVQWHPERTPDTIHSRRLFQALISAAQSKQTIPPQRVSQ